MVAAVYVLFFARYYSLTKGEWTVLIVLMALVFTAELFNTALEAALDRQTDRFDRYIKIAKDCAAGAVLVMALASAMVGVLFFWDVQVLRKIAGDILSGVLPFAAFCVSVVLSLFFVFGFSNKEHVEK